MELLYNSTNYIDFLRLLAIQFGAKVHNNFIRIPDAIGTGYVWAENLSDGLSILVTDGVLKKEYIFNRHPSHTQSYILHFNDINAESDGGGDNPDLKNGDSQILQQAVLLANINIATKFVLPANVRLRTVKIIFEKNSLLPYMTSEVFDEFVGSYFSEMAKTRVIEPLDAEYRDIVGELIKEKIDHPLRNIFINNRVRLLLERFAVKIMTRISSKSDMQKLSDDEIARLMMVEALLVKDYSLSPPTIDKLSKLSAMSPTKLKRDFKSMYGSPIYEYYQKNRMAYAKKLLTSGKYSIKEIGMLVGYSNLGHFAAAFKKEFDVLPSEMINTKDIRLEFQ
ncbi:AraC family transcriptional regulator [Danxiaibacter flavus]|uniref:AraC family transcriptional regulator n=1 Tax=Danxiaibacter flavus TaxID=3049108 RepID=A0ABV3ZDS4_9BACT|nr:AraC family transcriptional regulator [Chitinophagaceae bacterium DXS]